MNRLARIVLLFGVSPSTVGLAQIDYHRADLIRSAPSRMMGVPEWTGTYAIFGLGTVGTLEDSTRFWYRVKTVRGPEFVLVDPSKPSRQLLFDNSRLAAALSVAADSAIDPVRLGFRTVALLPGDRAIAVRIGKKRFECELAAYRCIKGDTLNVPEGADWAVRSPDRQWDAYVRKHNVWIRRAVTGPQDSIQLTTDGVAEFQYGLESASSPMPNPDLRKPTLWWSPDSKKIAVLKIDERGVRKMPVYSSTELAPKLFQYPIALAVDSTVSTYETHVLALDRKTNVKIDRPKQVLQAFGLTGDDAAQWSSKSDKLYLMEADRANKGARVVVGDAATGAARVVLADSMPTFIENASGVMTGNWAVLNDEDLIWWSERDGWGHLYRYGLDGKLKNRITSGPWLVDRIRHVDHATGQIYFIALGRDTTLPYYGHLMRVGLDGSGFTDLTPEPGRHLVHFLPTGRYFIDVHSRIDLPPVTTLRSAMDGRKLLDLEKGDPSGMLALGWTPPRPFKVKARDGVTDIYGFLHLPGNLDTTKRYPVIDHIYPGPQIGTIYDWGYYLAGEPRGLAELGFVVVELNALGTPGRSKAFHDFYYGNMGDNGIPDHIAAIKQLAARYPFMDADRVGIYGFSGGGFSSTGAILRYHDFFKVAVSGAGNHDNRSYRFDWGEKYQGRYKRDSVTGRDNFESQANYLLAGNLKGRLMLMHGDMDTNVHPAMTFRLVDALIKAGKDFDMLVLPDVGHQATDYAIKREWDYFVKWLLGAEPPRDYHMVKCEDC